MVRGPQTGMGQNRTERLKKSRDRTKCHFKAGAVEKVGTVCIGHKPETLSGVLVTFFEGLDYTTLVSRLCARMEEYLEKNIRVLQGKGVDIAKH